MSKYHFQKFKSRTKKWKKEKMFGFELVVIEQKVSIRKKNGNNVNRETERKC